MSISFASSLFVISQRLIWTGDLAFIDGAGNAVIKVDNTTNIDNEPLVYHNSVRIPITHPPAVQDAYAIGSLIIVDAVHISFGCSPSFWTLGNGGNWPAGGEIDLIEAINLMGNNQVAVHTNPGCTLNSGSAAQTGRTLQSDCSNSAGRAVAETKSNSYGETFAQAGGGVFAMQFDVSGVFTWFWSRSDSPDNIKNANSVSTMGMTSWGLPSSAYAASSCNITEMFEPQQLVLLTTLCGIWAGVPNIYANTCHTPTGNCFLDNIVGPGSNYDDAYWEVRCIQTYTVANGTAPSPSSSSSGSLPASSPAGTSSISGGTSPASSATSSASVPGTNDTSQLASAAVAVKVRWGWWGWWWVFLFLLCYDRLNFATVYHGGFVFG
ncbi:hypothetical protein BDQ17DRAFT_1424676 [Cyathus striatus]|nr:hypothetical protein BDQ17DRAFT_1424676 [Cyathus striatus]